MFNYAAAAALTFDVEELRVALAVADVVGGDAREEAGRRPAHGLQHQRLVRDQDLAHRRRRTTDAAAAQKLALKRGSADVNAGSSAAAIYGADRPMCNGHIHGVIE